MDNAQHNSTCSLSRKGEKVADIKFFYRHGCKVEDLQAFREKAWAQIDAGIAKEDKEFDSILLDD